MERPQFPNAAVVLANNYQFNPGQEVHTGYVQSRMLLWCKGGRGKVIVNGEQYEFTTGTLLMIPWEHAISYKADKKVPFLIAGVHIIPDYNRSVPFEYTAVHAARNPGLYKTSRRDLKIEKLEKTRFGKITATPALAHVAEYCVSISDQCKTDSSLAFTLGELMLKTVLLCIDEVTAVSGTRPEQLEKIVRWLDSHLDQQLSLFDICSFCGLSPSAVGRMFKKHFRLTPVHYITKIKLTHAKGLLATTRLSVTEIGRMVGIDDIYYFSKLFRKHESITPRHFRQRETLVKW